MSTAPIRIAVFASGGGSNLGVLLERFPSGHDPSVALVVTDRRGAGALERAATAGVSAVVVRPRDCATTEEFARRLLETLRQHRITLVVLAGYLRKIPESVVVAYPHRILNVHPALLPRFGGPGMYGARVHEAVLAARERESGATVHFVDAEYDNGPIIVQERVPVLAGDTAASLAARVLQVEHRLLPRAVELVAAGRVVVERDRTVRVLPDDSGKRGSAVAAASQGHSA